MRVRRLVRPGLAGFLVASLTGATCSVTTGPGGPFGISATVQFAQVEGGCWTLVTSEGTVYEPLDLPKELQEVGLRVRVWIEDVEDVASICMVGQVVEITEIRRA